MNCCVIVSLLLYRHLDDNVDGIDEGGEFIEQEGEYHGHFARPGKLPIDHTLVLLLLYAWFTYITNACFCYKWYVPLSYA